MGDADAGGQEYGAQKWEGRGLLRIYFAKMTGLSRAQVTRWIGQYLKSGMVKERRHRRNPFAIHYQADDVELLAAVDEAHEALSGPAPQRILCRVLEQTKSRPRRSSDNRLVEAKSGSCRIRPDGCGQARRRPTWRNGRARKATRRRPCGCKQARVESPRPGVPTFPLQQRFDLDSRIQKRGSEAALRSPPGSSFD